MIRINCPGCGKAFRVKDGLNVQAFAGKKVKCPECAGFLDIPGLVETPTPAAEIPSPQERGEKQRREEEERVRREEEPRQADAVNGNNLTPHAPTNQKQTKPCPFCGEEILACAQKCKHCGEYLTPALREARRPATPSTSSPQVVRTAKSRGIYIILGLFLGGLFGLHNFYAGRYKEAVAQLFIILMLGWVIIGIVINVIWVLIELCTVTKDGNGNPMT